MFLPNLTQDLFDTTATAAAADLSSFPFGVSLVNATIDPIPGSTGSTGENTYTSTFIEVNRGTVLAWRAVTGTEYDFDPVGDVGGGLYRDNRYDIALAMPSSGESSGTTVPLTVSIKVDLFPNWPTDDIPGISIVVEEKTPQQVFDDWEVGAITPSSVTTTSSMKWPIATWEDIVTNTGFEQLWIGNLPFPKIDKSRYLEKKVTHRTTLAGSPTLNGRADLVLSEAEILTETADSSETDYSDTGTYGGGWLETKITRWTYNSTGDEVLYLFVRDYEYDAYGRECSRSREFRVTVNSPDDCL